MKQIPGHSSQMAAIDGRGRVVVVGPISRIRTTERPVYHQLETIRREILKEEVN